MFKPYHNGFRAGYNGAPYLNPHKLWRNPFGHCMWFTGWCEGITARIRSHEYK